MDMTKLMQQIESAAGKELPDHIHSTVSRYIRSAIEVAQAQTRRELARETPPRFTGGERIVVKSSNVHFNYRRGMVIATYAGQDGRPPEYDVWLFFRMVESELEHDEA